MQVLMKHFEMVARFSCDGTPRPVKFQVALDEERVVIQIDKILFNTEEKLAGNRMIIFRCQSEINGILKLYELKYELQTMKWILWKI